MRIQDELWTKGIPAEIKFWDDWILMKGIHWPEDFEARLNDQTEFQSYLEKYLPTDKKYVDILDVGSGPFTFLGKKIKNKNVILKITCADPLADHYLTMIKKYGLTPTANMVKVKSEELSKSFPENYFDFVHMRNALDHAFDPLTAVGEMIKVVDKNRYIYLQHENNEAENESYQDLHQWNIRIEDGQFIIWNKSIRYNVSEHYKHLAKFNCTANETHNFIEIHKF